MPTEERLLVVSSPSASDRTACAKRWLNDRRPGEEILVVAASRHAADHLVRQIAKSRGAIFGWHRLSVPQLVMAIAEPLLASRQVVPLSPLGTSAMAARAIHDLDGENKLGGYRPIAKTPGFPRAVSSALAELRLADLTAAALHPTAPDLAGILAKYEAGLSDAGLTDWPGMLAIAAAAVRGDSIPSSRLVGLPLLLLDVPITTESEFEFISALITTAPSLLATIPSGDDETRARFQQMHGVAFESARTDSAKPSPDDVVSLRRLQANLFGQAIPPSPLPGDATVEVFSAPGEGRECVEIARRILRLAGEGMRFDRIAVLLRTPEQYRAHIEEAFSRAGIPVHLARGTMRPDPAGRAFCALLRCAAEGLSARRFAEFLSLGQVPDATADGRPPTATPAGDRWSVANHPLMSPSIIGSDSDIQSKGDDEPERNDEASPVRQGQLRAPRRWEKLLVEAAVIGGKDRWRRRLAGLAKALEIELTELGGDDEARVEARQRTLDDLRTFSRFAQPLIDDLDDLSGAVSWEVWLDRLGDLATRAIRRPERILSIFAELAPMRTVGPVSLAEVIAVLEDLLLEDPEPSPEPVYGRVFVAPVESARGLNFDAVFVPGLAEKIFPRKIVEEPLLLDGIRTQLPGGLPTNQTRLDRERLALGIAVGAADGQIAFSYPRLDLEQGRPRVPSFYALETVRASEGRLLDFAELARRAASTTSARLGWPAPMDAGEAIDTAEYDLAVIASISDDASAGAARYLLEANPYLGRALRNRFQRWGKKWTSADGLAASTVTREIMALQQLGVRSYSPTALQTFAACPYRFFLQVIHRLAPRDEPQEIERLDALQRGSFIHDCQFQLLQQLRERKLLPVNEKGLAAAYATLEEIVAETAARYRDDLAPAIDRVWDDEIAAIHVDLREWLRLASEDETGFVPWQFELAFGLGPHLDHRHVDAGSVSEAAELDCGIRLRGSIDLVERHPSGRIRITDHKTGKASARKGQKVAGGTSLQPLLYAMAAEKIYAGKAEVTGGRLYFCTSRGGFADHVVALDGEARAVVDEVATTIRNALDKSFLPAAPDSGQCDWCDYRCVCGPYEEVRVARKSTEPLDELAALRALP